METGIVVKVDKGLNIELKQYILDLEKQGKKLTKSEAIVELVRIGLKAESR